MKNISRREQPWLFPTGKQIKSFLTFPIKNHRKPLSLPHYNYSANGGYFLTICTKNKKHFFGEIKEDTMFLSEYGHLAKKYWENIPEHFDNVILDMFVIMPNHIHGIIFLENDIDGGDVSCPSDFVGNANSMKCVGNSHGCSLQQRCNTERIPKIMNQFKSSVTRNGKQFFPEIPFAWQKSFHDRIIRNEEELENVREYILNNPINWDLDEENNKNS